MDATSRQDLLYLWIFRHRTKARMQARGMAWLALHYNWFNYQTFNINSFYASEYQVVHVEHEV